MKLTQLVRLQRRIKEFLAKQRSIRIYREMCSHQMSDSDKQYVEDQIKSLGPFYFKTELEEQSMNLSLLEARQTYRFPDGTTYTGEWRTGTQIREGRGC